MQSVGNCPLDKLRLCMSLYQEYNAFFACYGLLYLVHDISTFVGYLMLNPFSYNCCIAVIQLYVDIYNYMWKHSQHNIRTSMNERTHFFIKNIPLTLYFRRGCEMVDVECVWEMSWRQEQTARYWYKVLLAAIAALLPHSSWAAQSGVTEDPSLLSGDCSHSVDIPTPTATGIHCFDLTHWLTDSNWLTN